jgi:hypothetical protein
MRHIYTSWLMVFHDEWVRVEDSGGKYSKLCTNIDKLVQHMKESDHDDSKVIEVHK